MSAPVPTLPMAQGATRWVAGLPCGPHELAAADGTPILPLPLFAMTGEMQVQNLDAVQQAPGTRGGVQVGFGVFAPLKFTFGSKEASTNGLLEFATLADRTAWVRSFQYACSVAKKFKWLDLGEEADGYVSVGVVSEMRRSTLLTFSLTFAALDPFPWLSQEVTVTGTPALCPNPTPGTAYPRITLTATASTVTVTVGARVLTIQTTPGRALVIDSALADGRVTDAGLLALYDGLFPRVEPGGSTLTFTGASGITVRYRVPALALPVISTTPPGPAPGGGTWNLVQSNGPNGGVLLSEPGLTETAGPNGGVILSGSGLAQTNGPNGGVVLS